MRAKLLFYSLAVFGALNINSQTQTYQINWTLGVNGASANRTIEVGDTIEWVWGDSGFHTVTNKAGSNETFDSGNQNGSGNIYSYTFMSIGSNDYQCNLHPVSMFGTITVVAEGTLSTEEFSISNFSIFPNPSNNKIILQFPVSINKISVKVFDVLGKQIYSSDNNSLKMSIDASTWNKGMYFVKAASEGRTKTKKIIKQ